MFEYLLIGAGFAFGAGEQAGPSQAFLVTRAAAKGWRRTLPAALSPLLSDGPIAVLTPMVLGRLPLTRPARYAAWRRSAPSVSRRSHP